MSVDFTGLTLLESQRIATPTNGAIYGAVWSKNTAFILYGMEIIVLTAGAQAASECRLETFDGVTTMATRVTGTSAAGTTFLDLVTDANKVRAANTSYRIRHITTDASAIYVVKVWGTPAIV